MVEKKIKSTLLHKGRAISFYRDAVRLPNGKEAVRDYMLHPGAVCVVPFISRSKVLVLRQYRYPVGQAIYEFPAGKIDKGEKSLTCAKRELLEETGHKAKHIKKINAFWPTPAFATELMDIYAAWGLEKGKAQLDEDEILDVIPMEFDTVLRWVKNGKIKDAKSVIAALAIKTFNYFPPR